MPFDKANPLVNKKKPSDYGCCPVPLNDKIRKAWLDMLEADAVGDSKNWTICQKCGGFWTPIYGTKRCDGTN
eukprot:g53006.t1